MDGSEVWRDMRLPPCTINWYLITYHCYTFKCNRNHFERSEVNEAKSDFVGKDLMVLLTASLIE